MMMEAIEFTGKIEGGTIKLPDELGAYDNAQALVILLLDEPVDLSAKKERLRRVFQAMEKVTMFSKIKDPVQWQKNIRDEWD